MASESSWGDLSTRTSALQEAAKKRASTVMAKMVLDIRRKRKQFLHIHRADDSAAKNAQAAGPQRREREGVATDGIAGVSVLCACSLTIPTPGHPCRVTGTASSKAHPAWRAAHNPRDTDHPIPAGEWNSLDPLSLGSSSSSTRSHVLCTRSHVTQDSTRSESE